MCYHLHLLSDTLATKSKQFQYLLQSSQQEKFIESMTAKKSQQSGVLQHAGRLKDISVVGDEEYFQ